jgi:hypothetical protein
MSFLTSDLEDIIIEPHTSIRGLLNYPQKKRN